MAIFIDCLPLRVNEHSICSGGGDFPDGQPWLRQRSGFVKQINWSQALAQFKCAQYCKSMYIGNLSTITYHPEKNELL